MVIDAQKKADDKKLIAPVFVPALAGHRFMGEVRARSTQAVRAPESDPPPRIHAPPTLP